MLVKRKRRRTKRHPYLLLAAAILCLSTGGGFLLWQFVEARDASLPPIELDIDPNIGIEPYVREFLTANDAAPLLPIIACESGFRHYEPNGSVLKNREGSSAIGIAQILASKHPDPRVLKSFNRRNNTSLTVDDFDITTVEGNLGYALVLYKVRGLRDWECAH